MRLAHWRIILAGVALLALVLMVSWLLLFPSAASAAGGVGLEVGVPSPTRRPPTHTPTPPIPTFTSTPSPTATATSSPTPTATTTPSPTPTGASGSPPTATVAPNSAATSTPTAATVPPTGAATGTANPGAGSSGSAGSGDANSQSADGPPGLLAWGLGALALLVFGALIALFVRLTPPQEQPVFDSSIQKPGHARLNKARQVRPERHAAQPMPAGDAAEPPLKEGQLWKLPPPEEPRPQAPLKPPRWLIDAGLLKEETGNLPAEDSREP